MAKRKWINCMVLFLTVRNLYFKREHKHFVCALQILGLFNFCVLFIG